MHRPIKSKSTAILLALFLGWLGAHKFYLRRPGQGILYIVFVWTFIPAVIGLIEAIYYAALDQDQFNFYYNRHMFDGDGNYKEQYEN